MKSFKDKFLSGVCLPFPALSPQSLHSTWSLEVCLGFAQSLYSIGGLFFLFPSHFQNVLLKFPASLPTVHSFCRLLLSEYGYGFLFSLPQLSGSMLGQES